MNQKGNNNTKYTVEEYIKTQNPIYPIYACTINQVYQPLTTILKPTDTVELFDIRNNYANLAYQYSLTLVYLEAVRRVLGNNITVKIANSLSKSIYTTIQASLTESVIRSIEEEMKNIVHAQLPIEEQRITREDAAAYLKTQKDGKDHRLSLYSNPQIQEIYQVKLGETIELSHIHLLPNTHYLTHFSLRRYRNGVLLRFPHPTNPTEIPSFMEQTLLYDAFAREDRWEKLLGINYTADLNQAAKQQDSEMIMVSEALHEKRIAQLAEEIYKQKKRMVLIAGPSSSGKTTFAKRLIIQLRVLGLRPLYLGTDDYFQNREDMKPDENGEIDFESIDAVDVTMLTEQMNALLQGKKVDIPRFDFVEGKKIFGERIVKLEENQPIVLEGIHGLNPDLTKGILEDEKFRIYISPLTSLNIDLHHRIPTTDVRLVRRIVRDARVRNRSASVTIEGWQSVRKGEDRWIFPYSDIADAFFNSSLIYELAVLKKYAKPLLMEIKEDEPAYPEARRLLTFLQYFEEMEADDIVSNSILREFVGGSLLVN